MCMIFNIWLVSSLHALTTWRWRSHLFYQPLIGLRMRWFHIRVHKMCSCCTGLPETFPCVLFLHIFSESAQLRVDFDEFYAIETWFSGSFLWQT